MRRKSPRTEQGPPKVPSYIVTFSDMTTLLLTFFVMLLSLSSVQDPELFYKGRGSFVQSLTDFGLGMIYGRKQGPEFSYDKIKYHIAERDKARGRTIDAKEEDIRRLFQEVSRHFITMPSQIVAESADFWLTGIRFAPGQAELDESAKKTLTDLAGHLLQKHDNAKSVGWFPQSGVPPYTGSLYVLGLADESTGFQQSGVPVEEQLWKLSAGRAQAVAQFLRQKFSASSEGLLSEDPDNPDSSSPWQVYFWGAGSGGEWVGQDSPISKNCHVLIGLLKDETDNSSR